MLQIRTNCAVLIIRDGQEDFVADWFPGSVRPFTRLQDQTSSYLGPQEHGIRLEDTIGASIMEWTKDVRMKCNSIGLDPTSLSKLRIVNEAPLICGTAKFFAAQQRLQAGY
jgi:hypothetical protein